MFNIESGASNAFRDELVARLERALDWAPGSVQAIVAGGDATEVEPATVAELNGASNGAGVDDTAPIEVTYRGYQLSLRPRKGATPEERLAAERAVMDAAIRSLHELGLD